MVHFNKVSSKAAKILDQPFLQKKISWIWRLEQVGLQLGYILHLIWIIKTY